MWELKKISDEEYFGIGDISISTPKELVVSASFLKDVYNRGLYEVLLFDKEIDDSTRKNFDIGKKLHSYILEMSEFDKKYYMSDIVDPFEDRELLEISEAAFLEAIRKECALKFPHLLDEVGAEVTIIGEINGVKVKAKLDKIVIDEDSKKIYIYDLKSTSIPMGSVSRDKKGEPWEIKRAIDMYHYDLQIYFYKLLAQKWAYAIFEKDFEAECFLVFASKADKKVRKIRLSSKTLQRGEEKYISAFDEVYAFVHHNLVVDELVA